MLCNSVCKYQPPSHSNMFASCFYISFIDHLFSLLQIQFAWLKIRTLPNIHTKKKIWHPFSKLLLRSVELKCWNRWLNGKKHILKFMIILTTLQLILMFVRHCVNIDQVFDVKNILSTQFTTIANIQQLWRLKIKQLQFTNK